MLETLSDTELLLSTIVLSIGSLLFMFLLLLSYFTKEKKLNIRNKIYGYLLITTLLLILTEFLEIMVIIFTNNYYALLISFKLHWGMGIFIFAGLYYYCIVFMDNIENKTFKEVINHSIHTKIMTVVNIIFAILFIILPFDFSNVTKSYMTFFPGPATYLIYIYCIVIETVLIIHLIKNRAKVFYRRKAALLSLLIVLVTTFVLQLINPYTAILVIGAVIQLFFLYFNVENPDLIMIEELEKAKNNIDRSNRAKTDFLSNMSYEIKEPMKEMIKFSNQLVNSDYTEEKVINDAKNIMTAGNNLLNTVNNILDISKIESGENILELKNYSILDVLEELTRIVNIKLNNKQVKFVLDLDNNIPIKLYGDANKLSQILINIIDNSIKYTNIGIIKLRINCEQLGDNARLNIRISDSGIGIKQEQLDILSEVLEKLNIESYANIKGNGLGLAITKKYLDLMNGTIKVDSKYKAGTAVYVDLTQKIIDKSTIGNMNVVINGSLKLNYIDCSKYNVLIVDDNKLNLLSTSKILSKYKFNIEMFDNSSDCINRIKMGKKYDLIFLDYAMPGINGIQLLHIIRTMDGCKLIPIILLTANVITGMRNEYLNEGFDDCLTKPINLKELDNIINRYFNNK